MGAGRLLGQGVSAIYGQKLTLGWGISWLRLQANGAQLVQGHPGEIPPLLPGLSQMGRKDCLEGILY